MTTKRIISQRAADAARFFDDVFAFPKIMLTFAALTFII